MTRSRRHAARYTGNLFRKHTRREKTTHTSATCAGGRGSDQTRVSSLRSAGYSELVQTAMAHAGMGLPRDEILGLKSRHRVSMMVRSCAHQLRKCTVYGSVVQPRRASHALVAVCRDQFVIDM